MHFDQPPGQRQAKAGARQIAGGAAAVIALKNQMLFFRCDAGAVILNVDMPAAGIMSGAKHHPRRRPRIFHRIVGQRAQHQPQQIGIGPDRIRQTGALDFQAMTIGQRRGGGHRIFQQRSQQGMARMHAMRQHVQPVAAEVIIEQR